MPLNSNPFFLPIMQSIEMLSNDIQRRQSEQREELRVVNREDRAYDRQIETEQRQVEREEKLRERQANEQEYGSLTKAVGEYETAKGKPGFQLTSQEEANMKAMQERSSMLVKEGGVIPRLGAYKGPGDTMLPKEVAAYFGYPPDEAVSEDTKSILVRAYRENQLQKAGVGRGATAGQKNVRDPLQIIQEMKQTAYARYLRGIQEEGDTEKLGINDTVYNSYLKQVRTIEEAYGSGKINDEEARQRLFKMAEYDNYYKEVMLNKGALQQTLDDVKKALMKVVED